MNIFSFYAQEIKFRSLYILFSFIVLLISSCLEFHPLIYHLTQPLGDFKVMLTDLPEMYLTIFHLSCYISFFSIFPIISYNIWAFLSPAFTLIEKRTLNSFFSISSINSIIIYCVTFCFIVPSVVDVFFLEPMNSFLIQIECLPKLYPYTLLVSRIFLISFIISQFPGFLFLINRFQLVSEELITKNRKICFIFIIFISALSSPPDIVSQFFISTLSIALYELLLVYHLWSFHKDTFKKNLTIKRISAIKAEIQ